MDMIRAIEYIKTEELIGKTMTLELKTETKGFWFKVTEYGTNKIGGDFIKGHDDEGLNRLIYCNDVDFIMFVR